MRIDDESAAVDEAIKTPILVSLFRAFGWLNVLGTLLVIFVVLVGHNPLLSLPTALMVAGSGCLLALVFFGVIGGVECSHLWRGSVQPPLVA